jgi:hypothetical protein
VLSFSHKEGYSFPCRNQAGSDEQLLSKQEDSMNPSVTTLLIVVAVIVVAFAVWAYMRRRRTTTLRQRFGPEYDRTVRDVGSEREAEANLADRAKRVEKLNLRDLDPAERDRFVLEWKGVQSRFVDSPKGALVEADDLLSSLMKARGYPMSDFEQRAADISVDHPQVVENYRAAHIIAVRHGKGDATTEDLRRAMVHYRALFDDLVQVPTRVEKREVA